MGLSQKYREQAVAERQAAKVLLDSDKLPLDVKTQIATVVGFCNANTLEALADLVDQLQLTIPIDPAMQRRRAIMERNDAIRKAAAKASVKGDWSEFDKLVAGSGGDGGSS